MDIKQQDSICMQANYIDYSVLSLLKSPFILSMLRIRRVLK